MRGTTQARAMVWEGKWEAVGGWKWRIKMFTSWGCWDCRWWHRCCGCCVEWVGEARHKKWKQLGDFWSDGEHVGNGGGDDVEGNWGCRFGHIGSERVQRVEQVGHRQVAHNAADFVVRKGRNEDESRWWEINDKITCRFECQNMTFENEPALWWGYRDGCDGLCRV